MNDATRKKLLTLSDYLAAKRRDYSAQCDQRIAVGLDGVELGHLATVFQEWEDALLDALESIK